MDQQTIVRLNTDLDEMENILGKVVELSDKCSGFMGTHNVQDNIKSLSAKVRSFKQQSQLYNNFEDNDELKSRFEVFTSHIQSELPLVISKLRNENEGSTSGPPPGGYTVPLLDQQMLDNDSDQLALIDANVQSIIAQSRELNAIFNRTFEELQNQRQKIVSIDYITTKAKMDMQNGNAELDKATGHQKSSSKTIIMIFSIVGAIVIGIVIFLTIFIIKNKKKDKGEQ